MITRTSTVGTLALDPHGFVSRTDRCGVGVRTRDRRFLEQFGVQVVMVTPTERQRTYRRPLIVAAGRERNGLYWNFLKSNPQIVTRDQFDGLLQKGNHADLREQPVNDDFVRFNAVYKKPDMRHPLERRAVEMLLRCRHRPMVVRRILRLSDEELRKIADQMFGEHYRPGPLFTYRGETYHDVLWDLDLVTCEGCLGTGSRLLFAEAGRVRGYTNVNLRQVWERDLVTARKPAPDLSAFGRNPRIEVAPQGW